MKLSVLLCGAVVLATAMPAAAVTIYSNDFSANINGFTGQGLLATAPSGEQFLGPLSASNVSTLTLNTSGVSTVTLSYSLYAIETVDGDGPYGGNSPTNPDSFVVAVRGGPTLLDNSFANYPGDTQNYPIVGSPDQSGASAVNTLGYGNFGDATYTFSQTFTVTGPTTLIDFTSNTNQSTDDEFYGLDNVVATGTPVTTGTVPEPASWALLLAGFGVVGGVMRRRVAAVSVAA